MKYYHRYKKFRMIVQSNFCRLVVAIEIKEQVKIPGDKWIDHIKRINLTFVKNTLDYFNNKLFFKQSYIYDFIRYLLYLYLFIFIFNFIRF